MSADIKDRPEISAAPNRDLEKGAVVDDDLVNNTVDTFSWTAVSVTVQDRLTKQDRKILADASGMVTCGEVMALMGPSGSGKTTLLNVLAQRTATSRARTEGEVKLDGQPTNWSTLRQLSSYVEQEDALIGSITVKETMTFAARLALTR